MHVVESPLIPAGLLPTLGLAAFVRQPDGRFQALTPAPAWVQGLFREDADGLIAPAETSNFLLHFLDGAVAIWDAEAPGRLTSGPFTEAGADGTERTLEATVVRTEEAAWLLLGPPTMSYAATQRLLQTARDEALDVERTRRRHAEREILLHCIVHDLANPLAGLRGGLRLLGTEALAPDDRELVEIARRQADRMQDLLRDVLGTFRREVDAMMPATGTPSDAVDALRQTAEALAPRARLDGVALVLDVPEAAPVVADPVRLERVAMNLVENAIRHSPEGGTVRLGVRVDPREVLLTVEDEGPGVPPEARGDLFRRLRPRGSVGQSGLGLYICRLAVESWGGTVGYDDRERGGARFWVRLKRPRERLTRDQEAGGRGQDKARG